MKPPVEHVRVSERGKDILVKIKRYTGLEHWNEICRIALCASLANPLPPTKVDKLADSNIDIEWKTFAGAYQSELASLTLLRAHKDGINISDKDHVTSYFRSHLERGIASLQTVKKLSSIYEMHIHTKESQ
jgi:DNA sulfur modification protein DndE